MFFSVTIPRSPTNTHCSTANCFLSRVKTSATVSFDKETVADVLTHYLTIRPRLWKPTMYGISVHCRFPQARPDRQVVSRQVV